jgi:hypothetical protein
MQKLINGFTYSFNRNIGWLDRSVRSFMGILAIAGVLYFSTENLILMIVCLVFALAQAWTVFSARCIICFFAGICTIDSKERKKLKDKSISIEI